MNQPTKNTTSSRDKVAIGVVAALVVIALFAGDNLQTLGLVVGGVLVYAVPTFVAYSRDVPNKGSVAVVNLLLGWTIVGWVIALAMAMRDPKASA